MSMSCHIQTDRSLLFFIIFSTNMRRDDVCEECVPVIRAYQAKCNLLTEQLHAVEVDRDNWKKKYLDFKQAEEDFR